MAKSTYEKTKTGQIMSNDASVRYNPAAKRGKGIPTHKSKKVGQVDVDDTSPRFNPTRKGK